MGKWEKYILFSSLLLLPYTIAFSFFLYQWLTGKTYKKLRHKLDETENFRHQLKIELDKLRIQKKYPHVNYDELFDQLDKSDIDLSLKSVCCAFLVAKHEHLWLHDVFIKYNYTQIIKKGMEYKNKDNIPPDIPTPNPPPPRKRVIQHEQLDQ